MKHIPQQLHLAYRPEIDGLRSFAVLPVLIYHLKISVGGGALLPGGFLGVDVFFVLSGFLITQLLLGEIAQTGSVNLWRFYVRRARRILPALLLVILVSMVAASMLMLPSELKRFAFSALAAVGFVSNIFWFVELREYGAQSGLLQPLLHTWSLAIEEQFYLFFPLLLLVLPRNRPAVLAWVIGMLLLASLIAAQATTLWNQNLSFFSPVSRAWELLAGSLLAVAALWRPKALCREAAWSRWLPAPALTILLISMAMMELTEIVHPGTETILTVVATSALLWYTRPGEPVTRLLSWSPLVYIGRLSYSLYLWHFPIFAFGRLNSVDLPDHVDMLLWCTLTFACSAASYHLVERPVRFDLSGRAFGAGLAFCLLSIVGYSSLASQTNLLSQSKVAQLTAIYGINEPDNGVLRKASWRLIADLAKKEGIGTETRTRHGPSEFERNTLWPANTKAERVLIVGNSHSKDMYNALTTNSDSFRGLSFARFDMREDFNLEHQALLFSSPNFKAASTVLIASLYQSDFASNLPPFIEALQEAGKHVVLSGYPAVFRSPGSLPLFDWATQRYGQPPIAGELNRQAYLWRVKKYQLFNEQIKALAEKLGIPFLSRYALVCSNDTKSCTLKTEEGIKALYDNHHWTVEGAKVFGERAASQGWAKVLRAPR